jgi:EF-P beta-lysylation protein EpmB
MKISKSNSFEWKSVLRKNFTDWKQLVTFLELDESHLSRITKVNHFPLSLPYRLASKIEKNNISDPILKQFLPMVEENTETSGFYLDPVGDNLSRKCSKLLHKYQGRALLVTTSACAMHCRYCFRRNFSYENSDKTFLNELEAIKNDPTIHEIILSGGDPLSLHNELLGKLLNLLDGISHIKTIRFHTRFPIGIPERIDSDLLAILSASCKQIIFVIHCNHARELDDDVISSLKSVQKLGIPVLNQSVLLKGVNDNFTAMKTLLEALISAGIIPYYLHQLDKAQGTAHFQTSEETGISLINELRKSLPGYAIPRYAKEIAGEASKTIIQMC